MDKATEDWVRETMDTAVKWLTEQGPFRDGMVEVKPVWGSPGELLLGKARHPSLGGEFIWFIGGKVDFDHIAGNVAAEPRDALRHFSLKWQLDASRLKGKPAQDLIGEAEGLYALVEDERFWNRDNTPSQSGHSQ